MNSFSAVNISGKKKKKDQPNALSIFIYHHVIYMCHLDIVAIIQTEKILLLVTHSHN